MATTSQHHLLRRAESIGLLMRHTANIGIGVVGLLGSNAQPLGRWLLGGLCLWSLYRVSTRSLRPLWSAADLVMTVVICVAIPVLAPDPNFFTSNTAPQAIAGTAVVSFSVCLPARFTLPMTGAIAAAYAVGAAGVLGWDRVWSVPALYYFALQWVTAGLIRLMLLRVAAVADRARDARESVEIGHQVQHAVRRFQREQLALLHDTAASTLLMVGQGVAVSRQRLASQARRDLSLLHDGPWQGTPSRMEVVGALRDALAFARTDVVFAGVPELWVDGMVGRVLVAAGRETLNNVDRHAAATLVEVDVGAGRITVTDDGTGFDPATVRPGRGLAESIIGRMREIGGDARVESTPGGGATVELVWTSGAQEQQPVDLTDIEHVIERCRFIYGAALVAYAVVNVLVTAPFRTGSVAQLASAAVGACCALGALPVLRGRCRVLVPVLISAAALVELVNSMTAPPEVLGSQGDWVQAGIGWCVLPVLLGLPVRWACGILAGLWTLGGVLELVRHPVPESWLNVGLGTGSILTVQLFALLYGLLLRDVAADVRSDVVAHRTLVARERIERAVADDYRRRYATLVGNVVPLLELLGTDAPVDGGVQRRARAETRRLRALFEESKTYDHPTVMQLRPVFDAAEARGIEVSVAVSGDLPVPASDEPSSLAGPVQCALGFAMVSAHVVLTAVPEGLIFSAVCREVGDVSAMSAALDRYPGTDVTVAGDTVWLTVLDTTPS